MSISKFVELITPLQLFSVKNLAKPKAGNRTLLAIVILTYCIGIGTFIVLFVTQNNSYTTETTVQVSDISDSEWTCSMASVVTQTIEVNSTAEPSEYYNFMSVSEVMDTCIDDFKTSDPCSNATSILITPGYSSSDYILYLVSSSPAATAESSTFYFVAAQNTDFNSELNVYKYDLASSTVSGGKLQYTYDRDCYLFTTVAMDRWGNGWFLGADVSGISMIDFSGNLGFALTICEGYGAAGCKGALLTNDNYYNMYVMRIVPVGNGEYRNSLFLYNASSSDNGPDGLEYVLSIETSSNKSVVQMAIYNPSPNSNIPLNESLFVYYLLGECSVGDIYVYHNHSSKLLYNVQLDFTYLQISATSNKVYFTGIFNGFSAVLSVTSEGDVSIATTFPDFGDLHTFQMVFNETQLIYPNYEFGLCLYQKVLNGSNYPILSGYADTVVGWYTCGSEVITSTLPTDLFSSSGCSLNGISWQLQYSDTYYAVAEYFSEQTRAYAYSQCNASLYNTICERVGYLPPYICSRKVYLPIFTIFAASIAYAHLLTVVLFAVFGILLSRWKMCSAKESASVENKVELNELHKTV